MDIKDTLKKWDIAREKIESLEKKIQKYKNIITKELNSKKTETISCGDYKVTRRRNTRTYLSKENIPDDIWQKYSSRCSYDALFLTKIKKSIN